MSALRGDEGALYEHYHDRLLRIVGSRVHGPRDLIEDACSAAWVILLRSQPDRSETLFGWLVTVAVHEAYELSRRDRRARPLSEYRDAEPEAHGDVMFARRPSLEDQLEARRALATLDELPEKSRRYLALQIAGYSYHEITELAGDVTWTNVNKWLAKAKRTLEARDAGGEP